MSMTQALAPHLPYLRRYARALTGAQKSGDAYVRASLQALLAGDQTLVADLPPRVALYKLFHTIWSSPASRFDQGSADMDAVDSPEGRLQSLSADRRAALLLTAVESFSLEEAAQILGESVEEVEHAIVDAQRSIEDELVSRILIIEDEPIIALDLENLVTELGHEVVATASTKDQAVK